MMTFADAGIEIPSSASGPEVQTQCPKCSGERRKKSAKCLSVNTEKRVWVCHHCGWAGGLADTDRRMILTGAGLNIGGRIRVHN